MGTAESNVTKMNEKKQKLQQYEKLYNKLLKEGFNNLLPELKQLTENLVMDISKNYEGSKSGIKKNVNDIDSSVQDIYSTLGILLNKLSAAIKKLNSEIGELKTMVDSE